MPLGNGPCQDCTEWLLIQLSPSHSISDRAYSLGGSAVSQLILPPFLHGREGSFPGYVPPNDMVGTPKYAVGVKPNNSGVMIGYQVDKFTHTWSVQYFIAQ